MTDTALGDYLKVLRKNKGYSQEFVASHLNIIRQTYSHYETGRISPPLESICVLSELYQVPLDSLLKFIMHNESEFELSSSPELPVPPQKQSNLTVKETELVSYFRLLDKRDKDDILDYIKLKSQKAAKRSHTQQKFEAIKKVRLRKGI